MQSPAIDCTRDLIVTIACLKDSKVPSERAKAEQAFKTLLDTHHRLLWHLVHDKMPPASKYGNLHFDPGKIFNELILKIWNHADSFNPQGNSPETGLRQFLGWVGVISRNLLNDTFTALKLENENVNYLTTCFEEFDELFTTGTESESISMVREVLEEMDPDDADLLLWSVMSQPLDGSPMRPDSQERDEICLKLGVTPDSLRQRRKRALARFKEAMLERLRV